MTNGKAELSKSRIKRLLRETTGMHVSDGGGDALHQICCKHFAAIAVEAASNAEHAGRKTITEADIKKANETLRRVTKVSDASFAV